MGSPDDVALDAETRVQLLGRVGEHLEGTREGAGLRVGIACARFNGRISQRLLAGALDALGECGVARHDTVVGWTPGAFELPMLARALASAPTPVDAVIALGAVIRGETGHYDFVAGECARGLASVQLRANVPVIFGVLTTNDVEQALARSAPDETNKGRECALAAIEMVTLLRRGSLVP